MALGYAVFLLAALAGCKRSDPPLSDQTCTSTVDASEACSSSSQCGAGLSCARYDGGVAPRCRPVLERLRRTQLITGFMVDELPLHIDSDGGTALLAWRAPAGTRYVNCVLFGCAPELAQSSDGVVIVANYDQCALRRQVFADSMEGTFEPDTADSITSSCQIGRYLTELSIACWSYDEIHLTAASRLVPVRPSEVPSLDRLVVDECRPGGDERSTEDLACHRGKDIAFGICHLGSCLERCEIGGTPCEPPAPKIQDAGSDAEIADVVTTSSRTCQPIADNGAQPDADRAGALGVCVPTTAADE
jgi:hypothetical protein